MKECSECKQLLSKQEFWNCKKTKDGLQYKCKQCQGGLQRLKVTGCTQDEYNLLYIKQQGCCAICNKHSSNLNRALSADHCHNSSKIRGLLCGNCNQALGKFKDSIEILKSAIEYLERN